MSAPNESELRIAMVPARAETWCDQCVALGLTVPTIFAGDKHAVFYLGDAEQGRTCVDCWERVLEELAEEGAIE